MADIAGGSGRRTQPGRSAGAGGAVAPPSFLTHRKAHGYEDGTNTITVSLGTVPSGKAWFIERMLVECNSAGASKFTLYDTEVDKRSRRSFTDLGNDDEADFSRPVYFPSGSEVIGEWTSADAGTVGYCIVQVREES